MRTHVHEESFDCTPEQLFALLVTPSAIRDWWGAARVIILPGSGGTWAAAWGSDEDNPNYVTTATMKIVDHPRRLLLTDYRYHTRSGPPPIEAAFETEFTVTASPRGARLRVAQSGFPAGAAGDEFLAACERGWRDTFAGIRRYLAGDVAP
jgi:uncharacterized protein YndB with AHSA1/START domain